MRRVVLVLLALITVIANVQAQAPDDPDLASYIRSNYTKFEYRIPMRDGVRLFTAVYLPNDGSERYPILMTRTPYSVGPYGADRYPPILGPGTEFAREGYIFVYQDVRGRFMSEGEFVNMRPHIPTKHGPEDVDESTDTYDTIEWLLEHLPDHNGRVGLWGNSYPGFYTSAGIIDGHPALAAAMPSAPIADWFWDDMHHHGAFVLNLSFNFFSSFGRPRDGLTTEWPERFDHGTPDGYRFFMELGPLSNANRRYLKDEVPFWNALTEHPNYDEFWRSRNILPHLRGIQCAVMVVGGLFDAEDLYGPLHTYRAIEDHNPGITNTLVMGPWRHGAWLHRSGRSLGEADFGFPTAELFRQRAMIPFFRHHLKGEGTLDLPEAWVFETGADRWREFAEWPPDILRDETLYPAPDGRLAFEAPTETTAYDQYVSDPAKPVPYTQTITTGWHAEYMVEDQRFAARRPDVLVYRSEPLDEDLTVAGPVTARLWVSTDRTAADWVVKLIDELPPRMPDAEQPAWGDEETGLGGTQRLVRLEAFRGRFRDGYSEPKPFEPGRPTQVEVPLQDVLHTFKRGHRIMIQVQSSLFPFIDRNPQTYVPNIFEAEIDDFVKAEHRLYRSAEHPTSIELTVLPARDAGPPELR